MEDYRELFINRVKELGDASGRRLSINTRSDDKGVFISVVESISVRYNGGAKWVEQPIDAIKCYYDEADGSGYDFVNYTYGQYFYQFDWYGWYDKLKQVKEK